MSNSHFEKWLFKSILGFLLIAGGMLFMYYSLTHNRGNWLLFGLICSLGVSLGAYLLSGGAINKVKSDLIKKQKQRQQST